MDDIGDALDFDTTGLDFMSSPIRAPVNISEDLQTQAEIADADADADCKCGDDEFNIYIYARR